MFIFPIISYEHFLILQFTVDANEIENWLDEKAVLVASLQHSKDLDSTERQLKKSTVLMDDLKHNKQNTLLLKQRAGEMQNENNPWKDEVIYKYVCFCVAHVVT